MEWAEATASFAGTYTALTYPAPLQFTYSFYGGSNVNAWLLVTDETSGIDIYNDALTLDSTNIINIYTTPDHDVSVSFGIKSTTSKPDFLIGGEGL